MKREVFNPADAFRVQYDLLNADEISIDLFCGGGGASAGLEIGLKKPVFAAVNHNPKAVAMHAVNHPHTRHFLQDVRAVDPLEMTEGRPVGWMHASPDCTHHSQAAGGQPRKKEIRDLPWVVPKFVGKIKPRIFSMENVQQMLEWCPLVAKRDPKTGRAVTTDKILDPATGKLIYRVAEPGEVVPVQKQYLVPNNKLKGKTWNQFIHDLKKLGYHLEWKLLRGCDYGAPTIRKRLYLIARNDGKPIIWPQPSHAKKPNKDQAKLPWAAGIIDFSDLGKSIFDRPKPLVIATNRRLAKGLVKFVIECKDPFIVPAHMLPKLDDIKDHSAAVKTVFAPYIGRDFSNGCGHAITEPLATTTASFNGHSSLVTAVMVPFLTEFANASNQRNWAVTRPLTTICAQVKWGHHALVTPLLKPALLPSQSDVDGALRVAAFLINYYGNGDARDIQAPLDTITTKDRLALVTVYYKGTPHLIIDIRLRMLRPRELYRGNGFPDNYIIDRGADGKRLTITEQVHMCGNSVPPPPLAALAAANYY